MCRLGKIKLQLALNMYQSNGGTMPGSNFQRLVSSWCAVSWTSMFQFKNAGAMNRQGINASRYGFYRHSMLCLGKDMQASDSRMSVKSWIFSVPKDNNMHIFFTNKMKCKKQKWNMSKNMRSEMVRICTSSMHWILPFGSCPVAMPRDLSRALEDFRSRLLSEAGVTSPAQARHMGKTDAFVVQMQRDAEMHFFVLLFGSARKSVESLLLFVLAEKGFSKKEAWAKKYLKRIVQVWRTWSIGWGLVSCVRHGTSWPVLPRVLSETGEWRHGFGGTATGSRWCTKFFLSENVLMCDLCSLVIAMTFEAFQIFWLILICPGKSLPLWKEA